ncbi:MAG: hypothetical protein ABJA60_06045 [Nitrosospira sp.]
MSRNEAPHFLLRIREPMVTVLILVLVFFAYGSVHAQGNSMDSPPSGQSSDGQYKRGETPTGQKYGIIKKGEPHKSEAAKNKSDRSNNKQEAKPGKGSIIDRDKRKNVEGSGPDPLGRY